MQNMVRQNLFYCLIKKSVWIQLHPDCTTSILSSKFLIGNFKKCDNQDDILHFLLQKL